MGEFEQQPAQKPEKKRRILRSVLFTFGIILLFLVSALTKIGRASCRERV